MVWRDPDEEQFEEIDATWEEFSYYTKENFRFLTFSEIDHLERASVFCIEQNVPTYGAIKRDFVPLNFLSSLFLQSHKGNLFKYVLRLVSVFEVKKKKENSMKLFL